MIASAQRGRALIVVGAVMCVLAAVLGTQANFESGDFIVGFIGGVGLVLALGGLFLAFAVKRRR